MQIRKYSLAPPPTPTPPTPPPIAYAGKRANVVGCQRPGKAVRGLPGAFVLTAHDLLERAKTDKNGGGNNKGSALDRHTSACIRP